MRVRSSDTASRNDSVFELESMIFATGKPKNPESQSSICSLSTEIRSSVLTTECRPATPASLEFYAFSSVDKKWKRPGSWTGVAARQSCFGLGIAF
jgi:hypothetical protein